MLLMFGTLRVRMPQADGMGNIVELLGADRLETLAFGGELLVDLDDLLGHNFVCFLSAAYEHKILSGGEPFMAIGVESEAEHNGLAPSLLFVSVSHFRKLKGG